MSKNNKKPFAKRANREAAKKAPEPPKLTMLTHGKDTNFPAWKEAMRNEVAIEFGLLVKIIDQGESLDPAEIDIYGRL
jgi:hypothetical protein